MWLRADHVDGQKDIQHAEPAHGAAKGRMKQDGHQRREMAEKVILFPDRSPRQIKQDGPHDTQDHHDYSAEHSIHE